VNTPAGHPADGRAVRPADGRAVRPADDAARPGTGQAPKLLAQARGITLRRGDNLVLQDVDIEVRAGRLHALVGPNGAGKSSLLGVLSGELRPDSGEVLLDGRPLDGSSAMELARLRSVLLQQITMSFPFTVRQVVEMGRTPWRRTPEEEADDAVVAESLAATDVAHLADRRFTSLSGGERARAALARVLAQRAPLLMLDEPTAALDIRHQELVLQRAREHTAAGGGVVLVVHDLGLAVAYADQVTVLDDGRVAADGPPAQVLTADLLSTVYEHPVEVFPHPVTGRPVILPVRAGV